MAVLSTMHAKVLAESNVEARRRPRDALDFLFGDASLALAEVVCDVHSCQKQAIRSSDSDDEEEGELVRQTSQASSPSRPLVPRGFGLDAATSLAALWPAATAAHYGLLTGDGVVMACLPIAVPFSVPQVSPESWLANKRARAFHRGVVLTVCAQGVLTIMKLSRGDLIGGLYDGVQCAMGSYAIQPEGQRFFPTYIMCCGFNGILGLLQVFQGYQGVPVHFLPALALVPPAVAVFGAYCGWQFCKEATGIAAGQNSVGQQDTCFVRVMGGDWWPSFLGPTVPVRQDNYRDWGRSSSSSRFSAFAGDGQRLGESR
eukprot:gb/GFBE01012966.1/.p1 GENE.gb/GFBE01012966.1/~~gb/GFBE01012966.1/.p1  ORF type:complete len:315 (+),score=46.95 gb/GFBE01012966.1/:1-945(+)